MAIKKYYDSDCNLGVLDGKTVAVIGFGSQGHAHSENLAESGVNVVVGLRKGSAHWEKASEFAATHPNFKVMEVEEAAKAGDVVMMLVPDELCADIYNKQVAPYMTEGKALAFAHGFNIHFKTITAPKNVDVIMIAPKGPGHIVRRLYTEGEGCPSLICVEQDFTGKVLVLSPEALREQYWGQENQLWYARSGFGCEPHSSGRAVFATCLSDGETARWNREDFIGVLDDKFLPDWAREKLEELMTQEQTDAPTMGGMKMK